MLSLNLNSARKAADIFARFLWPALLAIHIAPLIATLGHLSDGLTLVWIGKVLGILASMAFFGAKTADVHFLRVRCNLTAALLFLVVSGLMHDVSRKEIFAEPIGAASVVVLGAATKIKPRLAIRKLLDAWSSILVSLFRAAQWQRHAAILLGPPLYLFDRSCSIPRGPPLA